MQRMLLLMVKDTDFRIGIQHVRMGWNGENQFSSAMLRMDAAVVEMADRDGIEQVSVWTGRKIKASGPERLG